jgi:SPX domain protein involved in polyphosphate accumulation
MSATSREMYAPVAGRGFTVPLLPADSSVEVEHRAADSAAPAAGSRGAGGGGGPPMSFVRKTTKYWVRLRDVELVKRLVGAELPPPQAFGGGAAGAPQLTNSVYLDNTEKELYRGRLNKDSQAVAIRLRWYGPGEPQTVYVERKTHKDDWGGENSLKERFALHARNVHAFLCGEFTVEDAEASMHAQGKSDDEIAAMALLFGEVYEIIRSRRLEPEVRTQYMRLAWQSDANAKVRISMDTQLCMFLENPAVGASTLESGRWFRDPLEPLLPDEVTWFPHAVLELKLGQAEDDDDEEAPEWVSELLASCCHEVHKFSKFVHGTATLLPGFIAQVPYWMDDASIVSSITASHSPRQAAQARQRSKSSVEGALGLVSAEHPVCESGLLKPFMYKCDNFTKTGSGQT